MKITNELLERYASGDCNSGEVEAVEAWLSSDDTQMSFPVGFETDEYEKFNWESIDERSQPVLRKSVPLWSTALFGRWLAAAMLLVVFGLGYLTYRSKNFVEDSGTRQTTFKIVSTKPGEKTKVKLSDGSVIHLNSDSELRVPVRMDDSIRMVFLKGEAFLEVGKDAKRPFIVSTGYADIRVLGTQFNVREFVEEKSTTVVVKEGKVRFAPKNDASASVTLTGSKRGVYRAGSVIKVDKVSAGRYLEWVDNRLVFDDLTIDQIAKVLHRWYGVDVELATRQIGNQRFTGEFNDQPVEYVVDKLCYVLDFKYQISGKKIRIN